MACSVRLSGDQRRELWDRWRRGETLVEIGRALGRSTPNVFTMLKAHGGIAPAARRRRDTGLRLYEREEISRGMAAGLLAGAVAGRGGIGPVADVVSGAAGQAAGAAANGRGPFPAVDPCAR